MNSTLSLTLFLILYLYSTAVHAQLSNCKVEPCKNGARCVEQPNTLYGFSCICTPEWIGTTCTIRKGQTNVGGSGYEGGGSAGNVQSASGNSYYPPPKQNSPSYQPPHETKCLNGGTYVGNACKCPPGYSGTYCQNMVSNTCAMNPCKNGLCKAAAGTGFACQCYPGYYGTRCEYYRSSPQKGSNKALGWSLGTAIPFLFVCVGIGICIYCCCCRNKASTGKNSDNYAYGTGTSPSSGLTDGFGGLFGRLNTLLTQPPGEISTATSEHNHQRQPVLSTVTADRVTSTTKKMPDPDEVFRAYSPPPYQNNRY